ncbi:MAG: arginine--tRNA ligase [Clostridia bacterium]|nr:arginine--tRNA ligase [Clostridia bacterium]
MDGLKKQISRLICSQFDTLGIYPDELSGMFDATPDLKMGDFTLACFRLSKALRNSPQRIADQLCAALDGKIEGIKRIESVNGYLNFFVGDSEKLRQLDEMLSLGSGYGRNADGAGKTVCIDFSSPNIAKPFHIGHLGSTAIGNSIKRLYQFSGYKCVGINYLGDWGTQFGKLICAYKLWGEPEKIESDGVNELARIYKLFHERAEEDPSLNDKAREEFARLEAGDELNRSIWKKIRDISLDGKFMGVYRLLGVEFESFDGESFIAGRTGEVVDELKEKGLLEESDGAMVVRLDDFNMPPCIVLKADGSTIYATRDIASALYRKKTYNFDRSIYVTDAGQSLHFRQWFKVIGLMGYDWEDQLVHVPYGKISINGEKLATRTGNVVLLEDLFSEAIARVKKIIEEKNPDRENKDEIAKAVGVGAVIFNQLSAGRIKDVNFVWEDALNFDGNTGPYAQYTHARSRSVLERASVTGKINDVSFNAQENELFNLLSKFPEKVVAARESYEPSIITRYVLDVCQSFNRFYHDCPILKAEGDAKELRLRLCKVTAETLKNALWLIGLEAPEKI